MLLTLYQRVRDRDHLADLELDTRNDLQQDRVRRGTQETLLAKLGGESLAKRILVQNGNNAKDGDKRIRPSMNRRSSSASPATGRARQFNNG